MWAIILLYSYRYGIRFAVRTDRNILCWIITSIENTGKVARWRFRPSELELRILYRTGIKHKSWDGLSRLRPKGEDTTPLKDEFCVLEISLVSHNSSTHSADNEHKFIKKDQDNFIAFLTDVSVMTEDRGSPYTCIPTLHGFILEQTKDCECLVAFSAAGKPNSLFSFETDGVSVGVSLLHNISKGQLLSTLRCRASYLRQYCLTAGHTSERRMYDSMEKDTYWLHMANDVYASVCHCHSCPRNWLHYWRKRSLKLSEPAGPLYFVAMDI